MGLLDNIFGIISNKNQPAPSNSSQLPGNFLFFDVETPNSHNDKICSIGTIWYTPANGFREYSTLVNPETGFNARNIDIHGITADDVRTAPTFDRLWTDVFYPAFTESTVVAHNALFDLEVLSKTLRFYSLEQQELDYVCTLDLSRQYYPRLASHKLPDVCSGLGINFENHHDAMVDTRGCCEIFIETFRRYGNDVVLPATYKPSKATGTNRSRGAATNKDTLITGNMFDLVKMIAIDCRVTIEEATLLLNWLLDNESNLPAKICDQLVRTLSYAIRDGEINHQEEDELLASFNHLISPAEKSVDSVDFNGKSFCLTGNFDYGEKEKVGNVIISNGGNILNGVTKKCDYVVIGSRGDDRWSYGCYGNKVKRALELQNEGLPIKIIQESELF